MDESMIFLKEYFAFDFMSVFKPFPFDIGYDNRSVIINMTARRQLAFVALWEIKLEQMAAV